MKDSYKLDQILLDKFEIHRDFTKIFLDAFILINKDRKILKFNQAFSQMVDLHAVNIRRIMNLDDILSIKLPERSTTNVMEHILQSSYPTRVDDVLASSVMTNKKLSLILSSFPYLDENGEVLGACLMLRDVTAETNLQYKYKEKSIESITDPLTGLYTRRYFESQMEKEFIRCQDTHTPIALGIVLFDLDKFKEINDIHGHPAGDFVLQETARILKQNSRRKDVLGRYGGEELLVLIFDTDERAVTLAAEKFRHVIQSHLYIFEGKTISLTTSVGATMIRSLNDNKEDAIKRADDCLYHAKKNGRNRVFVDFGSGILAAQNHSTQP